MAFISSACASCAISGIDLLAAGPYSSVLSLPLPCSLKTSLSPLLFSLYLLSSSSLRLYPSIFLPLSLSLSLVAFFFWPGRPSQCEIMVNAAWQSDTTHSPGPAPSGFNLIWSEKWGVVVVVKGWWGEMKGWRTGCLLEGGAGDKMKGWRVILRRIVSPSFILPKLPSPLLTYNINSPQKV